MVDDVDEENDDAGSRHNIGGMWLSQLTEYGSSWIGF